MSLNPSATELTTAATDAALGILCLVLLGRLRRMPVREALKSMLWAWVFGLLAGGSFIGAVIHGLEIPPSLRSASWAVIYLSLALAVALFVVGAVGDWHGDAAARRLLPWSLATALAVFVLTGVFGGGFAIFIVYEAAAMLTALAIYVFLGARRRVQGANRVSAGIVLTLVAAAVQVSPLRARIVVPFDHNGLFHLIQMIATVTIASGVRRGLEDAERTARITAPEANRRSA